MDFDSLRENGIRASKAGQRFLNQPDASASDVEPTGDVMSRIKLAQEALSQQDRNPTLTSRKQGEQRVVSDYSAYNNHELSNNHRLSQLHDEDPSGLSFL
jgi:hypothetical protein